MLSAGGCGPTYVTVARELAGGQWEEISGSASGGGVSDHGTGVFNKSVAVDPNGRVYVVWSDDSSGDTEVYVKYHQPGGWASLGGSGEGGGVSGDDGESWHGDIVFDPQGGPYVGWEDDSGGNRSIRVKRFTDPRWEEVGQDISGNLGVWPDLVMDGQGRPVVAWEDYTAGPGRIFLKRFENDTWGELDQSASGDGISGNLGGAQFVSLAAGSDGNLYASWNDDRSGAMNVYLLHFNGSSWDDLGGSSTGEGISATPGRSWLSRLQLDPDSFPVICWHEDEGESRQAFVVHWDGSGWSGFGGPASLTAAGIAPDPSRNPTCTVDGSGRPMVFWERDDALGHNIHGAAWDGTQWTSLGPESGGISGTTTPSTWPGAAVDAATGTVYVAWEEQLSPTVREVYLKRYR